MRHAAEQQQQQQQQSIAVHLVSKLLFVPATTNGH
jgi:hypothetical protein